MPLRAAGKADHPKPLPQRNCALPNSGRPIHGKSYSVAHGAANIPAGPPLHGIPPLCNGGSGLACFYGRCLDGLRTPLRVPRSRGRSRAVQVGDRGERQLRSRGLFTKGPNESDDPRAQSPGRRPKPTRTCPQWTRTASPRQRSSCPAWTYPLKTCRALWRPGSVPSA
jgi:hypothetical protein